MKMSETKQKYIAKPPLRAKNKFKAAYKEDWKEFSFDIPTSRRYAVSNLGRWASFETDLLRDGFILKVVKTQGGLNYFAQLCTFAVEKKRGKEVKKRVSRLRTMQSLVAEKFLPNDDPENKTEVIHIDYDRSNNQVENLKWVTKAEAELHDKNDPNVLSKYGLNYKLRGHKLSIHKAKRLKKLVIEGRLKPTTLAKMFGVSLVQIYRIRWGELWAKLEVDDVNLDTEEEKEELANVA